MGSIRRWLAGLAMACGLAACSTGLAPSSIDIDQRRLEQAIASRFPYRTRWLGLIDVRVSQPTLTLLPQSNRVATEAELTVEEPLSGQPLRGALGFDSGLRFDASDNTLRLDQVRVSRVALAGLPQALAGQTGRLGIALAEQLLEGAVLYRLTDAQQQMLHRQGVQPGAIRVTPRGLTIDLMRQGPP